MARPPPCEVHHRSQRHHYFRCWRGEVPASALSPGLCSLSPSLPPCYRGLHYIDLLRFLTIRLLSATAIEPAVSHFADDAPCAVVVVAHSGEPLGSAKERNRAAPSGTARLRSVAVPRSSSPPHASRLVLAARPASAPPQETCSSSAPRLPVLRLELPVAEQAGLYFGSHFNLNSVTREFLIQPRPLIG